MPSRRTFLAGVGGIATLAGCTAGGSRSVARSPNETADSSSTTGDGEGVVDPKRGPTATVRQFYRALLAENVDALNTKLVNPKSPTYPVEAKHVPPAAFQGFSEVQIAAVEEVSVQDRVVQQLGEPTKLRDWKEELAAERLQYVHTTFYVKKPDETQEYEANTVDYTVETDNRWDVRYDTNRSTHGRDAGSETA